MSICQDSLIAQLLVSFQKTLEPVLLRSRVVLNRSEPFLLHLKAAPIYKQKVIILPNVTSRLGSLNRIVKDSVSRTANK